MTFEPMVCINFKYVAELTVTSSLLLQTLAVICKVCCICNSILNVFSVIEVNVIWIRERMAI